MSGSTDFHLNVHDIRFSRSFSSSRSANQKNIFIYINTYLNVNGFVVGRPLETNKQKINAITTQHQYNNKKETQAKESQIIIFYVL